MQQVTCELVKVWMGLLYADTARLSGRKERLRGR